MNNQVKKEASSNDSIESLNLTMQRMELNVLKVVGTLSERVNAMENKMDSLLLNINNLERNTSNTLATTVNGLATHLEKAHAANYEKQISHLAEVQTLSQIITALRQNPNAFDPVGGGIPLPVMQQQQQPPQQQQFSHQQQQQSTFRPVHPNLQAAPSIPQPPPQHVPMEPRPVAPAEPPKQFPVIKPNVAPEPSEKPSPFATNAGAFNFAQNQAQKPLFPPKPALPTATATAGSPAQPTETKSIFGNTGKPFSFANAATPAPTSNPFAPASIQSQQPTPPVNQQKALFTSPFANTGNNPISFTPATANTAATPNKPSTPSVQQNEHEENENPEEYVPDAHYEPVIPLPDKVDVVTGEESEQVLFKNRCKLYIFNSETKEVKERGVGDLKVLYNPEKKSYRVVMRREQVHKICANFRITKGMNIADKTGTNNCGIFNCVDFTDNNETGTPTVFIIRFREDTTYEEFKKLFNDISEGKQSEGAPIPAAAAQPKQVQAAPAVAEVKKEAETKKVEGFGDKFNKKEGEWDCQTCYVPNKKEDDACISCGTGKDGKEKSTSAPTFKPTTFSSANTSFSFGLNNSAQKPLFGTSSTTAPAAPSPAKTETQTTDSKPAETKSLFGTKPITFSFAPPKPAATTSPFATQATGSPFGGTKSATDGTQPKSLFGGSASSGANKTPLSFSSFASGTSFLDKKSDSPNTSFGAQTSSTFANKDKDEHEENENPEEYVPDAHYEPVIPLPDKVDVVTGEESEQVLFKNRCKLYIFNSETKEVKERGVGDLKVLFNPEKKSYRVVMRREQVHKICANFRITKGMNISDKTGTKGCGIFSCVDYSENPQNGTSTVFYARFREENVYEEFKKLFKEIAEGNHVPSGIPTTNAGESTSSITTSKPPNPTATVPKLPYIGDSNNPSVDVDEGEDEWAEEDYDEDYGEENYDEETEVLLEIDCKLTLGEAYKSPLSKNKNEEIYENVKLVVSVADEGVYKVEFDNGKDDPIFPHFIQNNTNYKKDGKNITFIARDHNAVRKSVKCEFKDAATAQKAFETLQECLESTDFQGDDDN